MCAKKQKTPLKRTNNTFIMLDWKAVTILNETFLFQNSVTWKQTCVIKCGLLLLKR